MDNSIFRKKTLERFSAPSDTSERIRGVRPHIRIFILAQVAIISALVFLYFSGVIFI